MAVDMCIGFFLDAWRAKAIHWPKGAYVLEIGSAEADWCETAKQLRPDIYLTAIDYRNQERNHADALICGDILTWEFPNEAFDAIVSVSAIEHIGLGAYGDPKDPDGDIKTIANCVKWLKPGGELYFDVPWRGKGQQLGNWKYRAYNEETWAERLAHPHLEETWSEIIAPPHPDAPYRACVCKKIV